MDESVIDKLKILAESAKYDVSCSSSGTTRSNQKGGIGNAAGWGIYAIVLPKTADAFPCLRLCLRTIASTIVLTVSTGEAMT